MPVVPSGTVMVNRYVALSDGTSLTGYQVLAPSGSLATNAPSSKATQPYRAPVPSRGWPIVPP